MGVGLPYNSMGVGLWSLLFYGPYYSMVWHFFQPDRKRTDPYVTHLTVTHPTLTNNIHKNASAPFPGPFK